MNLESVTVTPENLGKVLGAIELDLRQQVVSHLASMNVPERILGTVVWKRSVDRFQHERKYEGDSASLEELLPFVDFADVFQLLNAHNLALPPTLARYMKESTPQLQKLVPIRNREAHHRPLLYDDCLTTKAVAVYLVVSMETIWDNLKRTLTEIGSVGESISSGHIMNNLPIPDYEETGYVGRRKQIDALRKSIMHGAYPVITVFGDGGIGKTALTLKVAYDILESPGCSFDAIVWTSSKTQQLTPQEIVRVKDAIHTSVAMFQDVSNYLAGAKGTTAVEEILGYLADFKILLIMDNLETVVDDSIRDFLKRLPRGGSKVLITSRIGMGAYDEPFRLQPLEEGDSIQMLRALAEIRQVDELMKLPNGQLRSYCDTMQRNPLSIKWFVSAVQSGKRPEEVLDKPNLLLEFCMSNVYEYLSSTSKQILACMLCLPGKHSQAELAFLSDLDAYEVSQAIRQLRTTSMIGLSMTQHESTTESKFGLASLARDYLAVHHPSTPEAQRAFRKRKQAIVSALEQMDAERVTDPYSFYNIERRSQSDVIVAKYLFDALNARRRNQFSQALDLVAQARNLAPEYFEVHRVEGLIRVFQGDYATAQIAYETALELNPKSAPLHVFYGGFLLRNLDDAAAAYSEFEKAAELDPTSWQVQLELSRACLYLRRFDQAESSIRFLLGHISEMKSSLQRRVYDTYIQLYIRKGDHLELQRDWSGVLQSLEGLKTVFESCPANLIDHKMRMRLRRAITTARSCCDHLSLSQGQEHAADIYDWVCNTYDIEQLEESSLNLRNALYGRVVELNLSEGSATIQSNDEHEYPIVVASMNNLLDWEKIQVGTRVFFWTGYNDEEHQHKAVNVIVDEELDLWLVDT